MGGEQHALLEARTPGGATLDLEVAVTPAGLLSIGAMVAGILLGSALIVLSAGRVRRARDR